MELAVPSFVFTPGRDFRERTASGPLDDQMANLKITIDHDPTRLGAETGRIHVGIFHTPDCSPQSLTTLMPNPSVESAYETVLCQRQCL